MARFFDVTAAAASIELTPDGTGQAAFTVTNATGGPIGGEAVAVPRPGSEGATYIVDHPSRRYDAGATEHVAVNISVPPTVPAGTHGFLLRVLLAGGVPEEQYDDGPTVTYEVAEQKPPEVEPKVPAKRKIPWLLIGAVALIAVLVIGGIVAYVLTRPPATGTVVVITQVVNDDGLTAVPADFTQQVTSGGGGEPFSGAAAPGVTRTVNVGRYFVRQDPKANYSATFTAGCAGDLAAGETKTCWVTNDDWKYIIRPPINIPIPTFLPPVVRP